MIPCGLYPLFTEIVDAWGKQAYTGRDQKKFCFLLFDQKGNSY